MTTNRRYDMARVLLVILILGMIAVNGVYSRQVKTLDEQAQQATADYMSGKPVTMPDGVVVQGVHQTEFTTTNGAVEKSPEPAQWQAYAPWHVWTATNSGGRLVWWRMEGRTNYFTNSLPKGATGLVESVIQNPRGTSWYLVEEGTPSFDSGLGLGNVATDPEYQDAARLVFPVVGEFIRTSDRSQLPKSGSAIEWLHTNIAKGFPPTVTKTDADARAAVAFQNGFQAGVRMAEQRRLELELPSATQQAADMFRRSQGGQ